MKRLTLFVAAAGLAFLIAPTPLGVSQEVEPTVAAPVQKPRVEFYNHGYDGVVTAVTDQSISIRGSGYNHPVERERRFVYDRSLDVYHSEHGFHQLADIRVGDKVKSFITRVEGIDYCVYVSIMRRPGGRVPPAQGEERFAPTEGGMDLRHSVMMNAHQDLEERGIPLPRKCDFEAFKREIEEYRKKNPHPPGSRKP